MADRLERLQAQMMDALVEPDAVQPALTTLRECVGAPIAHFWAVGFDNLILESAINGPVDHQVLERMPEFMDIHPGVKALPSFKVGRVYRDQDFISWDEIRHNRAYQEVIVPSGLGHLASMPIEMSPDRYLGLAVHRSFDHDPFNNEEVQRFSMVVRACLPAFLMMSRLERGITRITLESFGEDVAAAVLTRTGRLLEHNQAFSELLDASIVKLDLNRQLDLGSANSAFAESLRHRTGAIWGRFALDRPSLPTRMLCTVWPIPRASSLFHGTAAATITIHPFDQPAVLDEQLASEMFQLTPAESDIAARLASGADLKQIAHARDSSIATVRTILKSVLLKTETHSQSELVVKLRPLMVQTR